MKRRIFGIGYILVLVLLLFGIRSTELPAGTASQNAPPAPAKNIILLIGDGMGMQVIGLMRDYARIIENRQLHLEELIEEGQIALVHASSVDKLAPDSSAAATAIATGKLTINGMVAMTPDGNRPPTILEMARGDSRSTGIVTTTSISHATPACFAAHAKERISEADIAAQLAGAGLTAMLGGGMAYWIPEGRAISEFAAIESAAGTGETSRRADDSNLLQQAAEAGFSIAHDRKNLLAAQDSPRLLGLFAASHLPYALDRMPDDVSNNVPSLAEMATSALAVLSRNEAGFFLLIEGGRIDHAAHNHDVAAMLAEAMEFDEAVGVAYRFAQAHPQTAIFVTADHATAAPSLSARYEDTAGDTLYPDAEAIKKIAKQDASFEALLVLLEKDASPSHLAKIIARHADVRIDERQAAKILRAGPLTPFHVIKPRYRKYGYIVQALGRALGKEYMMAWATAEHYAEPVLLISYGASPARSGYLEQTDIFEIMKAAGGL